MPTKLKVRAVSEKRGTKQVKESRHSPNVTPAAVAAASTKVTVKAKSAAEKGGISDKKLAPVLREVPAAAPTPTVAPAEVLPAFTKAVKFLQTLTDYERQRIVRYNTDTFNLDRMRQLLKKLDNPQNAFRSVHVGGTKGKGSVVAMTASMLQSCGYKVGTYTSPHLTDIRERIQINGEMISHADFARLMKQIEPLVAKIKPMCSSFDVLTALAFKYFAEQKVELAVVEVGLGGRLDSTNVISPEVTAITSISLDHMNQLGSTVAKIAAEKAGIFKPGIPAVTVVQDPAAEAVLKETAEKVGCQFDICGKTIEFSYRFESSRLQGPHNRIVLTTPHSKFEHLSVPLLGEHQAINCGLALSIVDRLKSRGIAINDQRALEGLAKTTLPGRLEILPLQPKVILDGAHNAASIDAMIRGIGQHVSYDSMVLIFGCCGDKDVNGMLSRIASGADKVIFVSVNNIRSADPHDLMNRYNEMHGKMCQVADSLDEAYSIAKRAVTKEDIICVTGSFYLVGEAKKYFAQVLAKQDAEARAAQR